MRKLSFLLLWMFCTVRGQTTYTYRYWFDVSSDTAREGIFTGNVFPLEVAVDTLKDWYHLLHFQVRDADGHWSPTYSKPFAIIPSSTPEERDLTGQKYRYWFDANSAVAREGTITGNVFPLDIPVDTLPDWYHLLHFQVRDANDHWSPIYSKPFAIIPSSTEERDLTGQKYRYWFDANDAAAREGTITGNVFPLDIPVDTLLDWYHLLHFQVREADGHWSPTYSKPFAILPSSTPEERDLTGQKYRYWFDANSAAAREGTITGNVFPLDITVDTLPDWYHLLHFQVRDANGHWSPTYSKPFAIIPSSTEERDLTGQKYRYWFDVNSAAAREETITGNVFPLDIPVDTLPDWYHLLHFQVRDKSGRWSVTHTKPFAIVPNYVTNGHDLTGQPYHYWFDSDNSTMVEGTLTGNVMSLDIPVTSLDEGEHSLLFQVQDKAGWWSPIVSGLFEIFTNGLTILSGDGGSVTFNEEVIRDDVKNYSISEGVDVELTLTPDEGYAIKSVVVDETSDVTDQVVDNKLTLTMNASMAVVVSYVLTDFMKLGDVNNDGRVSVADLSLTVSHLIGEQPQPFPPQQADANYDGEINAGDLARIVDLITGAVERGTHEVKVFKKLEEFKTDVLSGMITDNDVQIDFQNQAAYTTFQMALTLPEGTEVTDIQLSSQRKDNHILAKGRLEDGRLMVVAYSTDNSPLLGHDGLLLDIQTSAPVTGEVYVDDIVFVTEQGQVRKMSPFCISNATSVNGTKAFTTFSSNHDLGGRRITGKPHRGIYIIDGKKIIFK